MSISLIAALDEDHAIGRDNALPWHLSDDLKRFQSLTLGKCTLMGYNTALAIGKPLPGRRNLVLSRRHDAPYAGQDTVRSLEEAQLVAGGAGLMVIGGAEVYRTALPFARRMYLTWVATRVQGADAWFPRVNYREWVEVKRSHHAADDRHALAFDWVDYVREA